MIAVSSMTMICTPTKPEIDVMSGYNKNYGWNQQPDMNAMKNLLCNKKQHTKGESRQWEDIMMMLTKSVHKRNATNGKREKDHEILEHVVLNNVDTKDGQTADHQW